MKELAARWDLRITKGENGYRCNWLEDEDDQARIFETVFEEEPSEHGEVEAFQRLLYFITEHFDMYGSHHDARRIRIIVEGEDEEDQSSGHKIQVR